MPLGDPECYPGNITAECIDLVDKWNSNELNNVSFSESKVTSINEDIYTSYIYFNENTDNKLSLSEQILIKRGNQFILKTTAEIEIGDKLISYSNTNITEILVTSINIIEEEKRSFLFYREPYGLIVAGGTLAYNGCPVHTLTN